jgi:adenylate kinase
MVMLGPPGAGKGTQADVLTKELNIPAISTGDMLRDAVARETPVGLRAKSFMDAGELVPDEVIIGIITDRLSNPDCANGYILDGVPRTLVQAQALEDNGVDLDVVLSIEISDDEILDRLGGRRACPDCNTIFHVSSKPPKVDGICDECGATLIIRKDDNRETIVNRLQTYHKETMPLKEYYESRGILKSVESVHGVAETTAAVFKVLGL